MFFFIHIDFLSKLLYLYLAPQSFGDQVPLVVTLKGKILIFHYSHPLLYIKSVTTIYDIFQTLPLVPGWYLIYITNTFQQLN